jgi:hypothetical protein
MQLQSDEFRDRMQGQIVTDGSSTEEQHAEIPVHASVDERSPSSSTAAGPSASQRPLARFYMTSDLRAATGLTRTHLDFYLREAIIVPTARTESGYLLFDDSELGTLRQVITWRQSGLGIREIRARLGRENDADADNRGVSVAPG